MPREPMTTQEKAFREAVRKRAARLGFRLMTKWVKIEPQGLCRVYQLVPGDGSSAVPLLFITLIEVMAVIAWIAHSRQQALQTKGGAHAA